MIKRYNLQTEQTFGIIVSFESPASGLRSASRHEETDSADYALDFPGNVTFGPAMNAVNISFELLPDEVVEGTEHFRVSIMPQGDPYPEFSLPISTSLGFNAEAHAIILDDDCKHHAGHTPLL